MTDNSFTPIDLRIKRKRDDTDEHKTSSKKKSRNVNEHEIPLDLSVKSRQQQTHKTNPASHPTNSSAMSSIPFYDPANLLFNSSALLYDLFLANMNSFYQQQHQQQQQQQRPKVEPSVPIPKSTKQPPLSSSRIIKDNLTNKQESYACSCGDKYSNVAHLVSHLKSTNHTAQLSSTHDEVAKLVRGQDIWLSRDTNPANQILKCLRCSLSFETLPDLTAHMMKTNHFTQLLPSSVSSSSSSSAPPPPTMPSSSSSYHHSIPKQQQQHSPTKVLSSPSLIRSTCLICSQQFAREVDLVDHIQHHHQIRFNCTTCGMYFENENLYKEHILKEMHHRNGKANRNRDYFLNQCKTLQKRSFNFKSERPKSRSPIDREVEQVAFDLLDRIVKKEEEEEEEARETVAPANPTTNALSLLQNFVIKQAPTSNRHSDLNNNYDDENTNLSNDKSLPTNSFPSEEMSTSMPVKSNESPLVSLEKMLFYPTTTTTQSLSSTMNDNGTMSNLSNNSITTIKKKKFDKYRLFAEKMLRSTLS